MRDEGNKPEEGFLLAYFLVFCDVKIWKNPMIYCRIKTGTGVGIFHILCSPWRGKINNTTITKRGVAYGKIGRKGCSHYGR